MNMKALHLNTTRRRYVLGGIHKETSNLMAAQGDTIPNDRDLNDSTFVSVEPVPLQQNRHTWQTWNLLSTTFILRTWNGSGVRCGSWCSCHWSWSFVGHPVPFAGSNLSNGWWLVNKNPRFKRVRFVEKSQCFWSWWSAVESWESWSLINFFFSLEIRNGNR